MKQFIKMNDNNNQLSLGNFCKVIKKYSSNKKLANQLDIFCSLFNIDDANDSTINNYCIGNREIGNEYKDIIIKYKKNYYKDKLVMLDIVTNILIILEGYSNSYDNTSIDIINNNQKIASVCNELYNISKNDDTVNGEFINKIKKYIFDNDYYCCLVEFIFYIVLDKVQPIYINDVVINNLEKLLSNTNISIYSLEKFLTLQFNDGVTFAYSIKRLVKDNNPYATLELGLMEYRGDIVGYPRYNKAYEYLKKASLFNHPRANYFIARMLMEGKIGNKSDKDIELAYKYLEDAINLNSVASYNLMGLYFLNYVKDEKKAIHYFLEATKYKYVYAYNNLGKIYEDKKDYKKAFSYYIESANLEESWACNKVGELYRTGVGVEKDLKKAYYYYTLSLDVPFRLINNWAKYNLAKYFYLEGNYLAQIEVNEELAIKYLEDASSNNIIDAMIELLYYYSKKYFYSHDDKYMDYIDKYINMIECHDSFNDSYKKEIDDILKKIKHNLVIDRDIYNN